METIAEGTICIRCNERPATEIWVGTEGFMAYIHGDWQPYCKKCTIEEQIRYAEEAASRLPELKEQLEHL